MSRRWGSAAVLFGLVLAGAIALAIVAAGDRRKFAFTNTVRAEKVAATVVPGAEACQTNVETYAEANRVLLVYGTFRRPGPRLRIRLTDARSGRLVASGVRRAGYHDNQGAFTRLSRTVPKGLVVNVCVRDVGTRRVAIYGAPDVDALINPSHGTVQRRPGAPAHATLNDLDLNFFTSEAHSVLSRVPAIFRRAVPFHPGWVGQWTFWALLAGLLLGAPALLTVAMRAAERDGVADEL